MTTTSDAARDRLRSMALSLATGTGAIIDPRSFNAAIDAYGDAIRAEQQPAAPPPPAEQNVTRVIALHEQWVKAGPPPLGTLTSRWWDARLVELHDAISPAAEEAQQAGEGR